MNREMFEQKIKEIHDKYPDMLKHGHDEYRCRFYQDLLDIYFDYVKTLEKKLQE